MAHPPQHPNPAHSHEAPLDPADAVYDGLVRAQVYAQEHWRKLAAIGALVVVIASLAVGMREYRAAQRIRAAEALFAATAEETETARREALQEVVATYAGTGSGLHAAFAGAELAFAAEDYAAARAFYIQVVRAQETSPLAPAALLAIGATYEAEHRPDDAVASYQRVVEEYPDSYALPQARLALGRLAEARGDTETALTYYRDVATLHPGTAWEREVRPRLAVLTPTPTAPPSESAAPAFPLDTVR